MDASAAQLEHLRANPFVWREIKKLLAVIPEIPLGAETALHAVCANQLTSANIPDHQLVADEIVAIAIEAEAGGAVQTLAELAIKNQVAETLAGDQVFERFGHTCTQLTRGGEWIFATVL
jgi:hypothetical protein